MQYTSRTIRVSIPYIREAMASKDEFEALAFCLLVKLNVTSSTIHDATYRRLKEVTHMGSDRIRRILDFCTEHGMATFKEGTLIIGKLCTEGRELYKFNFRYAKRHGKGLNFFITLAKVKDMLRRAVLSDHIKRVENIRQTSKLTFNPQNLREYRKGRKLVRRLAVWGCDFFISNKRLANIAQCSVSKMQGIKRGMIKAGEIIRKCSNALVFGDATAFCLEGMYRYLGKDDRVFLFEHDGKIYRHNPNVYEYKGRNIVLVPKNTK